METPTVHMHTLKIGIIDPSGSDRGSTYEVIKESLAERIHLLPPFTRKLLRVPGGFHRPVWLEDPDFNLGYHLRRVGLPSPGTMRELDELIGEIAGWPLDRSKPLWQMWVVEGLADGGVAFVTKIHHAAADGVAASAMLANVMDIGPEPHARVRTVPLRNRVVRVPSGFELIVGAFLDHLLNLRRLPGLLLRTIRNIRAVIATRDLAVVRAPVPIKDVPKVSFNGSLSPRRGFATASLSLEDFKAVKNGFDVKMNDVVLAVVGGALRSYLLDRGELPETSLAASVPVGTDDPEAGPRLMGNAVSNMFTSLGTHLADPVERLHHVSRVTTEAKRNQATLGLDLMEQWVEYAPPGPLRAFMRAYERWGGANRHRPAVNCVVSNVPGPREPLYVAGAKLTGLYSVGPILPGIGLNVTVWSYVDRMNFSAMSCRELLADPHDITDRIGKAIAELVSELPAGNS